MFKIKQVLILFLILSSTVFSGCFAGVKPITEDLKQRITPNLTFHEVIRDPAVSVGKTVLWGGVILHTTVYKGRTVLEVIQKPLGRRDRPLETDQSAGRFLVEQSNQFLDPEIYKEGREVTVVGEIFKEEKRPLGEMEYRYPYVIATFIHLWQERPQPYDYRAYPYSPYCRPPFMYDCYDPFYPYPFFGPRPYGIWPYPGSHLLGPHFPHRHVPPPNKAK